MGKRSVGTVVIAVVLASGLVMSACGSPVPKSAQTVASPTSVVLSPHPTITTLRPAAPLRSLAPTTTWLSTTTTSIAAKPLLPPPTTPHPVVMNAAKAPVHAPHLATLPRLVHASTSKNGPAPTTPAPPSLPLSQTIDTVTNALPTSQLPVPPVSVPDPVAAVTDTVSQTVEQTVGPTSAICEATTPKKNSGSSTTTTSASPLPSPRLCPAELLVRYRTVTGDPDHGGTVHEFMSAPFVPTPLFADTGGGTSIAFIATLVVNSLDDFELTVNRTTGSAAKTDAPVTVEAIVIDPTATIEQQNISTGYKSTGRVPDKFAERILLNPKSQADSPFPNSSAELKITQAGAEGTLAAIADLFDGTPDQRVHQEAAELAMTPPPPHANVVAEIVGKKSCDTAPRPRGCDAADDAATKGQVVGISLAVDQKIDAAIHALVEPATDPPVDPADAPPLTRLVADATLTGVEATDLSKPDKPSLSVEAVMKLVGADESLQLPTVKFTTVKSLPSLGFDLCSGPVCATDPTTHLTTANSSSDTHLTLDAKHLSPEVDFHQRDDATKTALTGDYRLVTVGSATGFARVVLNLPTPIAAPTTAQLSKVAPDDDSRASSVELDTVDDAMSGVAATVFGLRSVHISTKQQVPLEDAAPDPSSTTYKPVVTIESDLTDAVPFSVAYTSRDSETPEPTMAVTGHVLDLPPVVRMTLDFVAQAVEMKDSDPIDHLDLHLASGAPFGSGLSANTVDVQAQELPERLTIDFGGHRQEAIDNLFGKDLPDIPDGATITGDHMGVVALDGHDDPAPIGRVDLNVYDRGEFPDAVPTFPDRLVQVGATKKAQKPQRAGYAWVRSQDKKLGVIALRVFAMEKGSIDIAGVPTRVPFRAASKLETPSDPVIGVHTLLADPMSLQVRYSDTHGAPAVSTVTQLGISNLPPTLAARLDLHSDEVTLDGNKSIDDMSFHMTGTDPIGNLSANTVDAQAQALPDHVAIDFAGHKDEALHNVVTPEFLPFRLLGQYDAAHFRVAATDDHGDPAPIGQVDLNIYDSNEFPDVPPAFPDKLDDGSGYARIRSADHHLGVVSLRIAGLKTATLDTVGIPSFKDDGTPKIGDDNVQETVPVVSIHTLLSDPIPFKVQYDDSESAGKSIAVQVGITDLPTRLAGLLDLFHSEVTLDGNREIEAMSFHMTGSEPISRTLSANAVDVQAQGLPARLKVDFAGHQGLMRDDLFAHGLPTDICSCTNVDGSHMGVVATDTNGDPAPIANVELNVYDDQEFPDGPPSFPERFLASGDQLPLDTTGQRGSRGGSGGGRVVGNYAWVRSAGDALGVVALRLPGIKSASIDTSKLPRIDAKGRVVPGADGKPVTDPVIGIKTDLSDAIPIRFRYSHDDLVVTHDQTDPTQVHGPDGHKLPPGVKAQTKSLVVQLDVNSLPTSLDAKLDLHSKQLSLVDDLPIKDMTFHMTGTDPLPDMTANTVDVHAQGLPERLDVDFGTDKKRALHDLFPAGPPKDARVVGGPKSGPDWLSYIDASHYGVAASDAARQPARIGQVDLNIYNSEEFDAPPAFPDKLDKGAGYAWIRSANKEIGVVAVRLSGLRSGSFDTASLPKLDDKFVAIRDKNGDLHKDPVIGIVTDLSDRIPFYVHYSDDAAATTNDPAKRTVVQLRLKNLPNSLHALLDLHGQKFSLAGDHGIGEMHLHMTGDHPLADKLIANTVDVVATDMSPKLDASFSPDDFVVAGNDESGQPRKIGDVALNIYDSAQYPDGPPKPPDGTEASHAWVRTTRDGDTSLVSFALAGLKFGELKLTKVEPVLDGHPDTGTTKFVLAPRTVLDAGAGSDSDPSSKSLIHPNQDAGRINTASDSEPKIIYDLHTELESPVGFSVLMQRMNGADDATRDLNVEGYIGKVPSSLRFHLDLSQNTADVAGSDPIDVVALRIAGKDPIVDGLPRTIQVVATGLPNHLAASFGRDELQLHGLVDSQPGRNIIAVPAKIGGISVEMHDADATGALPMAISRQDPHVDLTFTRNDRAKSVPCLLAKPGHEVSGCAPTPMTDASAYIKGLKTLDINLPHAVSPCTSPICLGRPIAPGQSPLTVHAVLDESIPLEVDYANDELAVSSNIDDLPTDMTLTLDTVAKGASVTGNKEIKHFDLTLHNKAGAFSATSLLADTIKMSADDLPKNVFASYADKLLGVRGSSDVAGDHLAKIGSLEFNAYTSSCSAGGRNDNKNDFGIRTCDGFGHGVTAITKPQYKDAGITMTMHTPTSTTPTAVTPRPAYCPPKPPSDHTNETSPAIATIAAHMTGLEDLSIRTDCDLQAEVDVADRIDLAFHATSDNGKVVPGLEMNVVDAHVTELPHKLTLNFGPTISVKATDQDDNPEYIGRVDALMYNTFDESEARARARRALDCGSGDGNVVFHNLPYIPGDNGSAPDHIMHLSIPRIASASVSLPATYRDNPAKDTGIVVNAHSDRLPSLCFDAAQLAYEPPKSDSSDPYPSNRGAQMDLTGRLDNLPPTLNFESAPKSAKASTFVVRTDGSNGPLQAKIHLFQGDENAAFGAKPAETSIDMSIPRVPDYLTFALGMRDADAGKEIVFSNLSKSAFDVNLNRIEVNPGGAATSAQQTAGLFVHGAIHDIPRVLDGCLSTASWACKDDYPEAFAGSHDRAGNTPGFAVMTNTHGTADKYLTLDLDVCTSDKGEPAPTNCETTDHRAVTIQGLQTKDVAMATDQEYSVGDCGQDNLPGAKSFTYINTGNDGIYVREVSHWTPNPTQDPNNGDDDNDCFVIFRYPGSATKGAARPLVANQWQFETISPHTDRDLVALGTALGSFITAGGLRALALSIPAVAASLGVFAGVYIGENGDTKFFDRLHGSLSCPESPDLFTDSVMDPKGLLGSRLPTTVGAIAGGAAGAAVGGGLLGLATFIVNVVVSGIVGGLTGDELRQQIEGGPRHTINLGWIMSHLGVC